MSSIQGDLFVSGTLVPGGLSVPAGAVTNSGVSANAEIVRTKLQLETLAEYPIPFTDFRVWDAFQTTLPGTAAADDLALIGGTFGSAAQQIRSLDFKNTTTTAYARAIVHMPAEYAAGETVNIRLRCGMITTVASSSCTVDIQCYRHDEDGGISADLCTTAATTINSLTAANVDFTITETTITPGDKLDIRITVAGTDSATGTAVIAAIFKASLLCDIRG